jgi:hypothetical protein
MPGLLFIPGRFQQGVDGLALTGAAAGAENAELSQRRPEGAKKREEKRNTLSLLLSLRTLGVLRACGGG